MSVKIMVDSACDISEADAIAMGGLLMPIEVRFGDEEFLDGVNILPNEFYSKLNNFKDIPQTSLINEFRWKSEFEKHVKNGDDLVVITLSSKLSGTYSAAVEAAKNFNGKVLVVDSMNAAIGERLLFEYALILVNQGIDAVTIKDRLDVEKSRIKLFAAVDTLKFLKKGGRISATTAFVGEMLSIKPLVSVIDGEVKLVGKAKGLKKANSQIIEFVKQTQGFDLQMPMGFLYSGTNKENLNKFLEETQSAWNFNNKDVNIHQIGCTIGTHVGPGAYGVAYFEK